MGAERAESRRHLELDSTMSSSKKIYSLHPNVVAGEHGQHHARIADSYRLSILLTHTCHIARVCCVVCAGGGRGGSGVEVRRRATTRVSAPYGRPGTAYVSSRTLLPCCGLETAATARPWPVPVRPGWLRMVMPWVRGAVRGWRCLISLSSRSKRLRDRRAA